MKSKDNSTGLNKEIDREMARITGRGTRGQPISKNNKIDLIDLKIVNNEDSLDIIVTGEDSTDGTRYKDVFKVTAIDLEESQYMDHKVDLRVSYRESIRYQKDIGENSYLEENMGDCRNKISENTDRYNDNYRVVNLTTVLDMIERDDGTVVNHTMGVPFDFYFKSKDFVYSKTIHEDFNCNNCSTIILLYFGPVNIRVEIDKDRKFKVL